VLKQLKLYKADREMLALSLATDKITRGMWPCFQPSPRFLSED
jgi:hypothetical protein